MEYMDMVSKIVEAEHTATELVQESQSRQAHLQQGLEQEVAELRTRYLERARHRLALVAETEQSAAEQSITLLDKKLQTALAQVETAFEKNKDTWVDTLFSMIVGAQP